MKEFLYTGTGILSFTHKQKDYVLAAGVHFLPDDSQFVQSLTEQGILIASTNETLTKKSKK